MDICWCGNKHLQPYSEHYNLCMSCGTLVCKEKFDSSLYHVINEKKDLYGENYWSKKMLHLSHLKQMKQLVDLYLKERCIYWLHYILQYVSVEKDILEIGCGLGQLPYMMKTLGYNQLALELSPEICSYAKQHLHINIQNGEIDSFSGKVDCIIAMDVLEHILDPIDFITKIQSRLNNEGILCLQLPCFNPKFDSFAKMRELNPRFLSLMEEKEHIFLYSKTSVERLLRQFGFTNIIFEPAFWGEDYDMFLFASKAPLKKRTWTEVETELESLATGYIYKALFNLFFECEEKQQKIEILEEQSNQRLEIMERLNKELSSEKKESVLRLELIEKQDAIIREIEADRQARLDIINKQQKIIEEIEADRQARLDIINKQKRLIEETEMGAYNGILSTSPK